MAEGMLSDYSDHPQGADTLWLTVFSTSSMNLGHPKGERSIVSSPSAGFIFSVFCFFAYRTYCTSSPFIRFNLPTTVCHGRRCSACVADETIYT